MKKYSKNTKFTKNDLLKLKTRRVIYRFIFKNPGLHFREICRKLNASRGTVSYHTKYLEKRGLITAKRNSRYTLYYAAKKIGKEEENLLQNIMSDTSRNILYYLMLIGGASQIELSRELKKHPTTIEFHLKRLMDLDIIELAPSNNSVIYLNTKNSAIIKRDKIGREIFFRIKNPGRLYDLLTVYYNKKYYNDDDADAFFYFVEDMADRIPKDFPDKLKTFKQAMEEIEKVVYDIFPNPYYC